MTIKRRQLIKACSILPFALIVAENPALAAPRVPGKTELLTALTERFTYLKNCQAIGQAYLQQYPEVMALERLYQAISKQSVVPNSQGDPFDWLSYQIRADFAKQNTIKIEGLVLSKTEAQLCALANSLKTTTS